MSVRACRVNMCVAIKKLSLILWLLEVIRRQSFFIVILIEL